MNRIDLAIRSFFWIFFNKKFSEKINELYGETKEKPVLEIEEKPVLAVPKGRSEAVQVLSLFQREGRLVDFLKEPIDSYNDAQIGAAVRDIHRDCSAVLSRVFSIEPLLNKDEGASVNVPQGFNPEQYRLTGNLTGNPPYQGILRHRGWKASKVELPVWKGNDSALDVIAPAEIELP
jgi:hypothetical protein